MVAVVAKRKLGRKGDRRRRSRSDGFGLEPISEKHVHCFHTQEVAHTRADVCCRCGIEKEVGAPLL